MKALFLMLAMMVSGSAMARSPILPADDTTVLAQYAVPMASLDDDGVVSNGSVWGVVKVKTDGTLSVDKFNYTWEFGNTPEFLGNVSITLNASVHRTILSYIIALSDAELDTVVSDVVCMMMPLPGPSTALKIRSGYDYDSRGFSGDIRVVSSNAGCWASIHTSPKNDYDRQVANSLMSALNILTLQLAN